MSDPFAGAAASPAHDPFAEDAGVYVLGALDEAERAAFEDHLAGCAACRAAVAEVADLPRLLAAVPPEGLADPPASVLRGLLAAVGQEGVGQEGAGQEGADGDLAARRGRRRRRWWTGAGLVAAAAAGFLAAALAGVPWGVDDGGPVADARVLALEPDAGRAVPVEASVALEPVAWGTRLTVTCTYRPASPAAAPDDPYGTGGAPVRYALVVLDAAGRAEQVATWTVVPGDELTVPAATATALDDIVEVRMLAGEEVVLAART